MATNVWTRHALKNFANKYAFYYSNNGVVLRVIFPHFYINKKINSSQ